MPSIYKAACVTLKDGAVPIDIGDAVEISGTDIKTPVTMNSAIRNVKASEYGKSKEDFLDEARDEAELIVLKARNEAQLITDNAGKEMDLLRAETLENTRKQGYTEGFDKGASEAEALKQEAESILRDARAERFQ